MRVAPDCASLRCALPGRGFGSARMPRVGRLADMSVDSKLQKHYALLLGISSLCEVKAVALQLGEKRVELVSEIKCNLVDRSVVS